MEKICRRTYVLAILLLPIMFQYSIGIATVTWGDALLAFSAFLLVITNRQKLMLSKAMLVLSGLVLISLLIKQFARGSVPQAILFTSLRYLFYLLAASLIPTVLGETDFAAKSYRLISLFVSVFLLLQVVAMMVFDTYLSGVILSFPLTDKSLHAYPALMQTLKVKRYMSVFGEPAHFATYVLGYLVVHFSTYKKKSLYGFLIAVLISLSIVLSTSITGMLILAGLWLLWLFKGFSVKYVSRRKVIFIILLTIVILLLLSQTEAVKYLLNRRVFEKQAAGRFIGFGYVIDYFKSASLLELLFGSGMDDIGHTVYLAGFPRMMFYFGIIGSFLFVITLAYMFYHGSDVNRKVILVVVALSLGTEMVFSSFILPYLLFVISVHGSFKLTIIRSILGRTT